jgi:hypothetical protein
VDTRTREAIRYLGYGSHAVDDHIYNLIRSSFEELEQVVDKRIVYRIFDVSYKENGHLNIGQLDIDSKNLKKNLRECPQVIMLGATLGTGVDRLTRKYALTDMARVVTLQACAAAMLEEYLDQWQQEKTEEMQKEGWYLRPRFSPGYGDFSIEHQKMMVQMLDASKKIGLTVTDSLMLTPTKSVTAVIGLSKVKRICPIQGCESCDKTDCEFRR